MLLNCVTLELAHVQYPTSYFGFEINIVMFFFYLEFAVTFCLL